MGFRVLTDDEVMSRAEEIYGNDCDVGLDADEKLDRAEDGSGCWVRAWVWIPSPEDE